MKEFILILLGSTIPKFILLKWKNCEIGSFRYDVADYAPASREIM